MKIPDATRGNGRMHWTRCSNTRRPVPRGMVLASVTRRDAAYLFAAISYVISAPSSLAAKVAGDWSSPGLGGRSTGRRGGGEEGGEGEETTGPRFYTTLSRVKVQELSQGEGRSANIGDKLLIDFVLRRSNGYFIYGTVEGVSFQPRDVPTGPIILSMDKSKTIAGLVDGLVGLKAGGKRRILVPPEAGYATEAGALLEAEPRMPTFATRRQLANHQTEPLLFEVQLVRVIE